ncbi:MAG: hypothetical protein KC766_08810 [Myxococcales bacterium]|nr:hypothetical protein [Myxococcales bacterium]
MAHYEAGPGDLELIVDTFSEGIGARMAYDVSVRCTELNVSADVDPTSPESLSGSVEIPVAAFVAHALYRNKSRRPADLSSSDARQIGEKSRDKLRDAFGTHIRLKLKAERRGPEALVLAEVEGTQATLRLSLSATPKGDALELTGKGEASLNELGVPKVKAPLGLMVVSDRIELKLSGKLRAA